MKYRCKLFEVTVLLGHNNKRGRKKAPDAVRVIAARDCVHARDRARRILCGVKEIIAVRPASVADLISRSREKGITLSLR